jgi:hypothetical protein
MRWNTDALRPVAATEKSATAAATAESFRIEAQEKRQRRRRRARRAAQEAAETDSALLREAPWERRELILQVAGTRG